MDLERRSSGVAKAGLATGITGLSIAALDALVAYKLNKDAFE